MNILGPLFVITAAISFALPASLVKLGLSAGAQPSGLIFFSFLFAALGLNFLQIISKFFSANQPPLTYKAQFQIIGAGTTTALTNICYFLALTYTSVAIVAVMLMQSVWMALLLNCARHKTKPTTPQITIILMILIGTVLATDLIGEIGAISFLGILLGFLSGFFYALTVYFSGNIGLQSSALRKASLMSIGAFAIVLIIPFIQDVGDLSAISAEWGAMIAVFSMIIPLVCLGLGLPRTSPAVGVILTSLELPAAILFAYAILGEHVAAVQWIGVIIIITAAALSHTKKTDHH